MEDGEHWGRIKSPGEDGEPYGEWRALGKIESLRDDEESWRGWRTFGRMESLGEDREAWGGYLKEVWEPWRGCLGEDGEP